MRFHSYHRRYLWAEKPIEDGFIADCWLGHAFSGSEEDNGLQALEAKVVHNPYSLACLQLKLPNVPIESLRILDAVT